MQPLERLFFFLLPATRVQHYEISRAGF